MDVTKQKILYVIVTVVILVTIILAWNFLSSEGAFTRATNFDFRLTVTPSSGTTVQGQSIVSTIKATLLKGKTQPVQLSVLSGCPTSTTCSLNPTIGNPTFSSTLTITTTIGTPIGSHFITIKGDGGSKTKTTTYTLTVNQAPCNCTVWTNGACGGVCISTQRQQTRACTPAGCDVQSRCIDDSTCISPDSCTDSDGGLVWNITGTISGYKNNVPYNYSDFCPVNTTLVEYYCSGTLALNTTHTCPCSIGRCIA